jgi:hypothetical protein
LTLLAGRTWFRGGSSRTKSLDSAPKTAGNKTYHFTLLAVSNSRPASEDLRVHAQIAIDSARSPSNVGSAGGTVRSCFTGATCWSVSLAMHLGVLIAAGMLLGSMPRGNTLMPHVFDTTIGEAGGDSIGGSFELSLPAPAATSVPMQSRPSVPPTEQAAALNLPPPPIDPIEPQPVAKPIAAGNWLPPSAFTSSGPQETPNAGHAGGMGSGDSSGGLAVGGTSLFGIPTAGRRIVYVFDRSTSMGGGLYSPLSLAKAELQASLDRLTEADQFQIVFYNSSPTPFMLAPQQPPRLVRATRSNQNLARGYIGSIIADGGTAHEEALVLALKMGPDTVFFLTDADEPVLNSGQLARIAGFCRGRVVLHAIEFGRGPSLGGDNFLKRIAQQNRGEYTYVDVTRPELYTARR